MHTTSTSSDPPRRWRQFSLRTLMVLMVLCAAGFSWLGAKLKEPKEQREAVKAIAEAGGRVAYERESGGMMETAVVGLARLFGTDLKGDVVEAWIFGRVTDAELKPLQALPRLRTLYLSSPQCTDASLESLAGLAQLQILSLAPDNSSSGVLPPSQITDVGLEHLARLPRLEILVLSHTQITDSGLKHLAKLPQLRDLFLEDTQITDAGLGHLKDLSQLLSLHLTGSRVTDRGIKELQKTLPNVTVVHKATSVR